MTHRRRHYYRAIALFLTGALPLVVQPSAIAGQIAMSRYVDRVVNELPSEITAVELVRILEGETGGGDESESGETLPVDLIDALKQCRLYSLVSDSVLLQATDQGGQAFVAKKSVTKPAQLPREQPVALTDLSVTYIASVGKRVSDEQPLGP